MPHVDDGATVHVDTINTDVHAAEATLDAALAEHQALPARLPLAEVNPGQQVLDTETKLIHHAIRIAAFNTTQSLARATWLDCSKPWPALGSGHDLAAE